MRSFHLLILLFVVAALAMHSNSESMLPFSDYDAEEKPRGGGRVRKADKPRGGGRVRKADPKPPGWFAYARPKGEAPISRESRSGRDRVKLFGRRKKAKRGGKRTTYTGPTGPPGSAVPGMPGRVFGKRGGIASRSSYERKFGEISW